MGNNSLHNSGKHKLRMSLLKHAEKIQCSEQIEADSKISRRLFELNVYKNAESVFLFVSVGHEVNTYQMLDRALRDKKRVYVPLCFGRGIMQAAKLTDIDKLVSGMYNIPTVPEGSEIISPEKLDLIIVPAVCFDRHGNRLGRGGGYYDRYLSLIGDNTTTIGVCRTSQLQEKIEVAEHDKKVDFIITDSETLKFK